MKNKLMVAGGVMISALVMSSPSFANASGEGVVTYISGNFGGVNPSYPSSVYFGISPAPVTRAECNTNGTYQFVFDPNTADGKALHSALLTAQTTSRKVTIQGTGACVLGQPMEGIAYWILLPSPSP
ncbi:MAG: hypothetical protein AABY83_00740 [Pseudomonadota bacterium]